MAVEKFLMIPGMHGPRNTGANGILLHLSEEGPTSHFKLSRADKGKPSGSEEGKIQIC